MDMSQYWNYVVIPTTIILILFLLFAIIDSSSVQAMSALGFNSSIRAIKHHKIG